MTNKGNMIHFTYPNFEDTLEVNLPSGTYIKTSDNSFLMFEEDFNELVDDGIIPLSTMDNPYKVVSCLKLY